MDTEVLVETRIEDGRKLIAELLRNAFDVTVALWVRTSEDGLWFLYIGSNSVHPEKLGDSYKTVYEYLRRIPDSSISLSEIKLVHSTNPIVRDAVAIRDRYPS